MINKTHILLVMMTGLAVLCPAVAQARTALIWGGAGTENNLPDGTLQSAIRAARAAGFQTEVVTGRLSQSDLDAASVWIQPGGPNFDQAADMQRTGVFSQVRDFVRAGGGYVGICGGAYMGQSYGSHGLGLLPGMAYRHQDYTHKVKVNWDGHERWIHFEEGPEMVRGQGIEVFATYDSNGAPAAIRGWYGAGRVVLSGVHPEAEASWEPVQDPDGPDLDLAIDLIQQAGR